MRNPFRKGWTLTLLLAAVAVFTACAESGAQLDRPKPYRPTATPAATQSPDFAAPKRK